jgi:hypothetical protein
MHKDTPSRALLAIAVLALAVLACGLYFNFDNPTPSPIPPPPLPPQILPTIAPPTQAPPPPTATDTVAPSPEAEVTAQQPASEVPADIQDYFGKGYLPYQTGKLITLDDYSKSAPGLSVKDLKSTGQQVQDFALWADIELKSTGETTYPDYTGCGFAYRVQGQNEGYTAILTNDYMRMGACTSGFKICDLFGTSYSFNKGQVDVPNGSVARFAMAVNRNRAWVFVDGQEVGQYTLYETRLTGSGGLYYTAIGDINKGYWTSCKITNARLWKSEP